MNKRSANFTEGEKTTLLQLVYQYKSVLESKKTDAVNNQKKSETWSKLMEQFNASSGRSPRDALNLRSKYDDLKKNLRKKMGNNQRERFRTGGGPGPKLHLSTDEELLLSLIGPSTCGLQDRGGGDKQFSLNIDETEKRNEAAVDILEENIGHLIDDNDHDNDGLSYRPSDAIHILKRPIHDVLVGDVACDDENVETQKSFSSLECYEQPKRRKRKPNQDKLDALIDEYEDLKDERKLLLTEQTNYYRDKNKRENELFLIEMELKKSQKEEQDLKLKKLKESLINN